MCPTSTTKYGKRRVGPPRGLFVGIADPLEYGDLGGDVSAAVFALAEERRGTI